MSHFARVTALDGKVHWINLEHVRLLQELKPLPQQPVRTSIHIDSYWVERQIIVQERPEEIMARG
ncbi:hypothetical protein [Brevundimonas sp.]